MKQRERKPKRDGRTRLSAWLHSVQARCALIMAVGFLVILVLFLVAYAPKRYNVTEGSISPYTINATRDVVDEVATEERRQEARNKVDPVYTLDGSVGDVVTSNLRLACKALMDVQTYGATLRNPEDTAATIRTMTYSDAQIAHAVTLLGDLKLTRYQITTVMRSEADDIKAMENALIIAVTNALNTGINEGQVDQSINTIKQIVGFSVPLNLMQNIVPTLLNTYVQPNMIINQGEMQQRQQDAAAKVEPVTYQQGQCIVRSGEIVTHAQYMMLSSLSLLSNKRVDYKGYLGVSLQVIAAMLFMWLLQALLDKSCFSDFRRASVTMLVLVIDAAMCVVTAHFANLYVAPVVMGTMLLTCLLGWRFGLPVGVGLSMLVAGIATTGASSSSGQVVQVLMMNLVGVILSARFLAKANQRMQVVLCGLIVALTDMLCTAAIGMMISTSTTELLKIMVWEVAGAVLSGMVALGLQPIFEVIFNLATFNKLQELSNPAQPLLRKLMIEAPGTYHHSIIVANLAEAAAERIDANPALARTASYYHDVGKLKRPLYFKENQMGQNLHDRTDPYVSAAIVTSHTRDGVLLAQKYHLPPEVQSIILEHHGDTPVMFFYHKACQASPDKQIHIDDFRYDGRRPSTRESAIVMLADTVEAAVRSMSNPTPETIREFIVKLVQGKLDDGQLDNAPLTLKEITQIEEAFCTVLQGAFHDRIEYPNVEVPHRHIAEAPAPQAADPAVTPAEPQPAPASVQEDISSPAPETDIPPESQATSQEVVP